MIKVEIDEGSGFCFGVVTAIHKAEGGDWQRVKRSIALEISYTTAGR